MKTNFMYALIHHQFIKWLSPIHVDSHIVKYCQLLNLILIHTQIDFKI